MSRRLTIVSNRLPIVLEEVDGEWRVEPGSGGLVQAMRPLLDRREGRWIGWPGTTEPAESGWGGRVDAWADDQSFEVVPVGQTPEEYRGYYVGCANSILWPLFHELIDQCEFDPSYFEAYRRVNRRFAEAINERHTGGELIWVHDYHLMLLPRWLDESVRRSPVGFFLHTPFPQPETFRRLPWREEVLGSLLDYDLVGFQSARDLEGFRRSVEEWTDAVVVGRDERVAIRRGAQTVTAGVFPIGCDYQDFAGRAEREPVTRRIGGLRDCIGDYQVILGVDRLDYTKGLVERLEGFERALERYPILQEEVVLYQLVVPSRESVYEYRQLKERIDRIIGRIEGRFSTSAWQPIQYRYTSVGMRELTALYRYATAVLITSIRDGMNLVAKEYCASQVDETGVLILSEFAGASDQLSDGALTVNPHDREAIAEAIHRSIVMPRRERVGRMRRLRRTIHQTDVYQWAESFLAALGGSRYSESRRRNRSTSSGSAST